MKEFIRLCGIAACTLLLLTGCSSKYERDDEPGRVENITVAKMQEMVDKKESFAIVFTQTTCSHCIEYDSENLSGNERNTFPLLCEGRKAGKSIGKR